MASFHLLEGRVLEEVEEGTDHRDRRDRQVGEVEAHQEDHIGVVAGYGQNRTKLPVCKILLKNDGKEWIGLQHQSA